MERPVHFDLAAAEKSIRAHLAASKQEAMRLADCDDGRQLVELQCGLDGVIVATALWQMRCANEGASSRLMIEAFGNIIGTEIASFAGNFDHPIDTVNKLMELIAEAVAATINGGAEGAVTGKVRIDGVVGGRA